jgi:hypothetical protein
MSVAELGFKINSQPITQATRELDRLTISSRQTEKEVQRLGQASANAMGFIKSFGGAFVGAFASTQTIRLVREIVDQVAKIGDVAARVGVTTQYLQALRYAILQNGGAAGDADRAITQFTKSVGEAATGQGYLFRLMRENNVQLKDKTITEVWESFLDILRRAPDEATRLRMATRVLGNELGPNFAQLAKQGPQAVQRSYEELQKRGAALSDEQIANAQKIDAEWKKLEYTIGMRVKGAIVDVASATRGLVDSLNANPEWLVALVKSAAAAAGPLGALATALANISGVTGANPGAIMPAGKLGAPRIPERSSRDPGTRDITNEYTRLQKSLEKQIVTLQAEAATYGQGEGAIERYRVQQQLLLAAEQAKLQITPKLRAEVDRIAEAYGKAADAAARVKLRTDLAFERDQLGRTEIEGNVAARLKSANLPINLESTEANLIRINEQLRISKELSTDFVVDFGRNLRQELANGAKGWEAFKNAGLNALQRLADRLLEMQLQNLALKAFGGVNFFSFFGGAGGSAGTGIGGMAGFAEGGMINGPGTGRSDSILARVSNGEYIVNAQAASRHRELLDTINFDRAPGFANGGVVGGLPGLGSRSGLDINVSIDDDGKLAVIARQQGREGGAEAADIRVRTFSSKELPGRVQDIERNPRKRG